MGDNPTVKSAEEETGLQPLNAAPGEPQPPQNTPAVSDPTLDVPPGLQNLPPPFQPFVLGLDAANTRTKNKQSISPATYPSNSEFEDLVKAGLKPEGPARAESVKAEDVKWPEGYREIMKRVESDGEERDLKVFRVVQGKNKSEMFVVSVDLENDRLVGVRFPEQ